MGNFVRDQKTDHQVIKDYIPSWLLCKKWPRKLKSVSVLFTQSERRKHIRELASMIGFVEGLDKPYRLHSLTKTVRGRTVRSEFCEDFVECEGDHCKVLQ